MKDISMMVIETVPEGFTMTMGVITMESGKTTACTGSANFTTITMVY